MARPRKLTEIDPDTRTAHCTDCAGRVAVVPFRRPDGSTAWRCAAKKKAAANRWAVRHDLATSWRTVGNGAAHGDYLGTATRRPTHTGHDGDKATLSDLLDNGPGISVRKAPLSVDGPGWDPVPPSDAPITRRYAGEGTQDRRWRSTGDLVVARRDEVQVDALESRMDELVAAGLARRTGRWLLAVRRPTQPPRIAGGRPGPVLCEFPYGEGWA